MSMDGEQSANQAQERPNGLASATEDAAGSTAATILESEGHPAPARAAKPRRAAKRTKGRRKAKGGSPTSQSAKRGRRAFPASTFQDALVIPQAIQQFASGQRIRRLTLFENLNKSPDSGPSRQLVTNANKYGLITGNYQSEWLELTADGSAATNADATPAQRLRAKFKLAIESIQPFDSLYQQYKGNKVPAQSVMRDHFTEQDLGADVNECVDTFIVNAKDLGLLRTIAGAERILPIEQIIEELPRPEARHAAFEESVAADGGSATTPPVDADWSKVCFYVTPIGEPESEERKHSDLFLSSIVEPAMAEFGMTVIRADNIGKAGMITAQVIQHVINAKLVIADLSFHNPNVFYELCLRHACRRPTVQLIRRADRIPFDLDQFRTIVIDTTDIYSLVPAMESYKSEIATHARRALDDPSVDNPLTIFCPGFSVSVPVGETAQPV